MSSSFGEYDRLTSEEEFTIIRGDEHPIDNFMWVIFSCWILLLCFLVTWAAISFSFYSKTSTICGQGSFDIPQIALNIGILLCISIATVISIGIVFICIHNKILKFDTRFSYIIEYFVIIGGKIVFLVAFAQQFALTYRRYVAEVQCSNVSSNDLVFQWIFPSLSILLYLILYASLLGDFKYRKRHTTLFTNFNSHYSKI